jgi:hypothetical protein
MAWHTLNEAVKLTGRSRRSIYRDMDRGLVSYGLDPAGNRQFETSELMRAYGALAPMAQPGTPEMAQAGTAQPWDQVLAELQALRKEVQELRATVLLIEHKPEPPSVAKPSAPEQPKEPATWANLLSALDE